VLARRNKRGVIIEMTNKKKLTFEQAEEIRYAYKMNPKISYRDLEEIYGVSKTLIGEIINNKAYTEEDKEREAKGFGIW